MANIEESVEREAEFFGEFFAEQICRQFNEATCSTKFSASFKFTTVTPILKQGTEI